MAGKLVILLALFLCLGFVSAACVVEEDIMFRIANNTNAHVSTYLQSPTYIDVCYSDFFGPYSGNTGTVHDCGASNTIFWINNIGNSHVSELTNLPTYDTEICYGDLDCEITNDESCPPSGSGPRIPIGYLSGTTNDHFSTVADPLYPYKICCYSSSGPSGTSNAIWTDAEGNQITEAYDGETIFATMLGATVPGLFTIYEEDVSGTNDQLSPETPGGILGPNARLQWVAHWSAIQAAGGGDPEDPDASEIKFRYNPGGIIGDPLNLLYCGDGIENGLEVCDHGANNGIPCTAPYGTTCTGCNANCTAPVIITGPHCGDGTVNLADNEDCDESSNNGNLTYLRGLASFPSGHTECSNGDYCSATCQCDDPANPNPYWADTNGDPIPEASLGSDVFLIYPGGWTASKTDFDISENSAPSRFVRTVTATVDSPLNPGDALATWHATSDDVKMNDLPNEFYMEINGATSGLLSITEGNDPSITISNVTPECGTYYKTGPRYINFTLSDPNDAVNVYIYVKGIEEKKWLNTNVQKFSYKHDFQTEGTNKIEIYAETVDGNDHLSVISNIVIYKSGSTTGTYAAACIEKPANYDNLGSGYVEFDAGTSTVIDVVGGIPAEIRGPLHNKYDDINFKWKFTADTTQTYDLGGNDVRAYEFKKYFGEYGRNSAELEIEYTP